MNSERVWSPIFIIIIGSALCCFLVGQGANAGTSVYLEKMGQDSGLAGIGAMIFSFAAAFGRIVSGPTIDKFGRWPLLVLGSVVLFFGAVGPLLDANATFFALWRALQGLGFSIATTASATAAADVLPLSRLGEGIGYYGLGQAISMSIGPALAIFLISTDPPENFYVGLTVCSIGAIVFAACCRYEKHPLKLPPTAEYRIRFEKGKVGDKFANAADSSKEDVATKSNLDDKVDKPPKKFNLWDSIFEPAALRGTVPMMFIAVAYGFGIFFIGLFGSSLGVGSPGLFFTIAAVSMIVIRLTSGAFMDKVHPIYIMGAAVFCAIVVYGTFIFCENSEFCPLIEWVFYAAGLFYGVSLGIALPINQTIAVRMSDTSRWGAANGLFMLVNDIVLGAASMICGFTVLLFGYTPTFIGIISSVSLSFLFAFLLYPKERV